MLHRVVAILALLIFLSAARALDGPQDKARPDPPEKSKTVAEQVKDLQEEVQKVRKEILEKYRKAEKDEEKQELAQQYTGAGRTFAGRFLELARKNAADPAAVTALVFILTDADGSPEAVTAAEVIVTDHLNHPQVLALTPQLARSSAAAAETVLRGIIEHAKDDAERGKATFALAQSLKERVGMVRQVKGAAPDLLQRIKARLGDEGLKRLQEADPAKLEGQAEKLLERVVETFADVKPSERSPRTLGDQAKGELFELRHLAVGKKAPDIEAEDIDGTKFKLSDYRGKVVMIDFWGHW